MTACALVALVSLSAANARDPVFEQKVRSQLEQLAPSAVPAFEAATAALDAGKYDDAVTGYEAVIAAAPDFDTAHRRLCSTLVLLRRVSDARPHCARAVELQPSADNEAALLRVRVLEDLDSDVAATRQRLRKLLESEPVGSDRWVEVKYLECLHKQKRGGGEAVACGEEFVTATPREPIANYLAVESAVRSNDWPLAFERLELARPGIDPAEYDRVHALLLANEPVTSKYGRPAVKAGAMWAVFVGLLVSLGLLLSSLAVRSARRLATVRDEHATSGAKALRRLYRGILAVGSVFYYVSLPLVLAAVILIGGGIIYGFVATGQIPIKLVIIVGFTVLVTIGAVLKSLFVRARDEDPGEKLDWEKAPKLRAVLERVASAVGTRPVDTVYLTPGTELAVFERGGMRARWSGKSERCLILGVGVLDGFRVGPFMSVLAHEYGHFSHQDTAGGDLALWTRRSLMTMGIALAEGGAAAWYNPAWLFFRGYWAVFLRISQGASRLQEVLADRRAIFTYGSAAFREGYTHAIRRGVAFDAHASATLKEVIEQKKQLGNLYAFAPAAPPSSSDLDQALKEALEREPSAYDSHPSSKDRLAWAESLAISGRDEPGAQDEVWSLFASRAETEQLLTTVIRANIAVAHQVVIEGGATP